MINRGESRGVPEPRDGQRRLAAIAFTDIVGYSALVHRDDANALMLVNEHFALVREVSGTFGGRIIKTIGDSVHLEFGSAQAATMCAVAVQQRHQQRNERVSEVQRFEIRIGIHLGDVDPSGGDIYGDGVNIAARLQPLAPVGGIAISGFVLGQLREELRTRFASRGTAELKNIATPVDLFVIEAAAIREIPVDPPGTASAPPRARRAFPAQAALAALAVVAILVAVAVGFRAMRPHGLSAAAEAGDKSIAVLPFANMSSDKEQEYFSDGIADDLLNLLTKVQSLQVAARTSSFSFKGQNLEIPEIARRLHVANVLQGSVRRAGNQVRITAQLVRAADGYQIWSQSWDRQLDDVFRIQDEIARAVVDQLRVQLLGEVPTAGAVDPRAYPLILQADASNDQNSAAGRAQAVELYRQALAIAPNEARALSGLARTYVNQGVFTERPFSEVGPLARDAANKALALDPANARAVTMLSRLAQVFDLDLPGAARYIQRAIELEPGNVSVLGTASVILQNIGRIDEAAQLAEDRVARDPANPTAYHNLGFFRYLRREPPSG